MPVGVRLIGVRVATMCRACARRLVLVAILAVGAVGAGGVFVASASAAVGGGGDLDGDVVSGSGQVLGTLHGSVAGRFGFAVIRPASRRLRGSWVRLTVGTPAAFTGRAHAASGLVLLGRGAGGVRLTLALHGDRLGGSGTAAGGLHVRVVGYGGLARPSAGSGVLLMVDAAVARGEVRAALRRVYPFRRALGRSLTRARILADPSRLDGVAGVVVRSGSALRRLVRTGMLRTLADAHRWVVVLSPGSRDLRLLRGILPVPRLTRRAPAVALRATGVQGGSDALRVVVVFPSAPSLTGYLKGSPGGSIARVTLTGAQRVRLRAQRIAAFARELLRYDAPYARPRNGGAVAAGAGPSAECTQAGTTPVSAVGVWSCYQVDVIETNQLAVGPPGNLEPLCLFQPGVGPGQNVVNDAPMYCPGTSQFQSIAGSTTATPTPGQLEQACQAALNTTPGTNWLLPLVQSTIPGKGSFDTKWMTQSTPVQAYQLGTNSTWSYTTPCPSLEAQTATYEIDDSYFAMYEPFASQQGVLAVTNGELTPNSANQTGGPAIPQSNGSWYYQTPGNPYTVGNSAKSIPETAWFPGQVLTGASYTPPAGATGQQAFAYQLQSSFPQNQITNTVQEQSSTESTAGWSLGINDGGPSLSWSSPGESWTDATFVNVPDWSVLPNAEYQPSGQSSVFYNWTSQSPTSWQTMQCTIASNNAQPCNQPFGTSALNTLNTNAWSPSSQTAWSGAQTGGVPTATIAQQLSFVDHYSGLNTYYGSGESPTPSPASDFFETWQNTQSSGSTATTLFGAQELDLCDPLVTPTGGQTLPLC